MKFYYIRYIGLNGKKTWELVQTQSVSDLLSRFSKQSMTLLNIKEVPKILHLFLKLFSRNVSKLEIAELLANLHVIVKAGLPLYQGLEDLELENKNPTIKRMLQSVNSEIASGVPLSRAFEPYERFFGKVIINLIRIGEETGALETTLLRGSAFLKRSYELRKKVVSALIYPAVVLSVVLVAILIWFAFVLPMLAQLFAQMDIVLPTLTKILIQMSHFTQLYFFHVVLTVALMIVATMALYKKSPIFRSKIDSLVMQLPLVGKVVRFYNNAFITEYLHLSLSSGIPLYTAIETVRNNTRNRHYQKSLIEVQKSLLKGEQLSLALQNTQLFTPFTVRMLHIGENSGNIENQLQTVSSYYYEKVDEYAQNVSKVIAPAIIIFIGGFYALIMVAMMGPIVDIVIEVI